MFAKERYEKIVKILEQQHKVSVSELSRELSVSEVTIRKDLEYLEQQGSLTRTFGGALYLEPAKAASTSCSIPPESLDDYGRKQAIGMLAANLVDDEDFIFLGPGYTCLEVGKNLRSKNRLAITTMNVSACIELADTPEFNVMLAPGSFTKRNGTYYVTGSVLIDYFSNAYFDKIFLTMDGIDLSRGFSVLDDVTARIFHVLVQHTNQVIVCAASSKFGKNAMAHFAPLTIADVIVTDGPAPAEYRKYFEENGIQIVCPEN